MPARSQRIPKEPFTGSSKKLELALKASVSNCTTKRASTLRLSLKGHVLAYIKNRLIEKIIEKGYRLNNRTEIRAEPCK